MFEKFVIGHPVRTDAVVMETEKLNALPDIFYLNKKNHTISMKLLDNDIVYGLGETVRGMNKRGFVYESYNTDEPNHMEFKTRLYSSLNFIIVFSKERCVGLFIDNPGLVRFDVGFSKSDEMCIYMKYMDADVYVESADTPIDIVRDFRRLTGENYMPPKWAFGLGQSRWSYMNEDEVMDIVNRYEKNNIPLDSIYLDIDYMERYKDFTVNEERFPKFKEFAWKMKDKKIHLVPIIDAGVKIEKGYDVYEEGVSNNYFCKDKEGKDLVAAVWPGLVHFPDVLNKDARKWFGDKYKFLTDMGIDGFWNDMNEPAIFYTKNHLDEVFDKIDDYKGKELDINSFFEFKNLVASIDNYDGDYESFYHDMDGEKVLHDKVHNLYGFNMTRAAAESFKEICPGKDILLFSRASYTGMHRYSGVWTGDNMSVWSHILLCMQQMPGLNMNGFLYSGADMGGFGADASKELVLRWLSLSIFTPLFRNHAAAGTRRQEFDMFDDTDTFRKLIELRYSLFPYIYNEFKKATRNYDMYMKPLAFEYTSDDRAMHVEDQLLVGDNIMIAPIYTQNAIGRYVYLPEKMKLLTFRSFNDYDEEVLDKGDHFIFAKENEIPIFLREGKMLPLARPVRHIEDIDYSNIYMCKFSEDAIGYDWVD